MALTIYKYSIEVTDVQMVSMPIGAEILTVQVQNETPCIWALVDSNAPLENVKIRVHGTGHPVNGEENLEYIGTFQLLGGRLVFHTFKIK